MGCSKARCGHQAAAAAAAAAGWTSSRVAGQEALPSPSSRPKWSIRRPSGLVPLHQDVSADRAVRGGQGMGGITVLGRQGISGWLSHGISEDASGSPSMTNQYVCLRSSDSGRDDGSSLYSVYVFDSADECHGYFAGGKQDPGLVRHRLDIRDVKNVHELLDADQDARAIELEVMDRSGGGLSASEGGDSGSRGVWMLQAASGADHQKWLLALHGLCVEKGMGGDADTHAGADAMLQSKQHAIFAAETIDLSSNANSASSDGVADGVSVMNGLQRQASFRRSG